jgi:hypothetical protein
MRRFQRIQNHKNPITGCREIDDIAYTKKFSVTSILTINFTVANDWNFTILGLLESYYQEEFEFNS